MTIGYIRVSTDAQNLNNQKHKILEYAQTHKLMIDDFVELYDKLIGALEAQ